MITKVSSHTSVGNIYANKNTPATETTFDFLSIVKKYDSTNLSSNPLAERESKLDEGTHISFSEPIAMSQNLPSDSLTLSNDALSEEALNGQQDSEKMSNITDRSYRMLKLRELSEDEINSFREILAQAENVQSAKGFLKSLSTKERALVKKANSYGPDLINSHIDEMSEEGARNMLVQPDYRFAVDFNNDGIVESGKAKTFVFPPPNAPESVKDAWDKTMESLDEDERLLASTIFLVMSWQENIKTSKNGRVARMMEPGEPDYVNIFGTDELSWLLLLDKVDDYLDFTEKLASANREDIEKDRQMIDTFRKNIIG